MPVLTLATFLLAFPELDQPSPLASASVPQAALITALLGEVEGVHIVSSEFFGTTLVEIANSGIFVTRTQYAQLLLTAHFYVASRAANRGGFFAPGQPTSYTSGSNETWGFSTLKFSNDQNMILSTTPYGLRLIDQRLANAGCVTGFVVV